MPTDSVDISDVPDAVPVARRFASDALVRFGCLEVVDSAELVVSELVTNALLHAGLPVRLTVAGADNIVRIEVQDCSRDIPVRSQLQASGMTGRGLALVDAVSQGWGADPPAEGKIVWAEITAASAAAHPPVLPPTIRISVCFSVMLSSVLGLRKPTFDYQCQDVFAVERNALRNDH